MKCKHCGNSITGDVNFCTSCGKPVDMKENVDLVQNVDKKENVAPEENGRKLYYDTTSSEDIGTINAIGNDYSGSKIDGLFGLFAIIFATIVSVLMLVTLISGFSMDSLFRNKKVIELGTDEITTIYGAIDKGKKICSYSISGSGTKEKVKLGYCDNHLVQADYDKYVDYLVNEEGFEEVSVSGKKKVRKYFNDYSYEIVVTIDSNASTIIYDRNDLSSDYENNDIED